MKALRFWLPCMLVVLAVPRPARAQWVVPCDPDVPHTYSSLPQILRSPSILAPEAGKLEEMPAPVSLVPLPPYVPVPPPTLPAVGDEQPEQIPAPQKREPRELAELALQGTMPRTEYVVDFQGGETPRSGQEWFFWTTDTIRGGIGAVVTGVKGAASNAGRGLSSYASTPPWRWRELRESNACMQNCEPPCLPEHATPSTTGPPSTPRVD